MLKDNQLEKIIRELETIKHVITLRIHTRLPVVIPSRITASLCYCLNTTRLRTVIVSHINHAQEIDHEVMSAFAKLPHNTTLLNQSVLLHGVNDSVDALCDLSHACFSLGILPYYCHLLDPVSGTAHFNVNEACAVELISGVRARLPGYLVPRLSREVPDRDSKTVIA